MTTTVIVKVTEVQDQVVEIIGKAKDPVVQSVTAVVDFVLDQVNDIPAIPFAEYIPTPVEVVNSQYKFAKSLVDTNKDLALSVAKAVAPLTDQVLDRKSVRSAAPKATVRKATAKTA